MLWRPSAQRRALSPPLVLSGLRSSTISCRPRLHMPGAKKLVTLADHDAAELQQLCCSSSRGVADVPARSR
jgi:hypothetical protein